MAAEDRTTTNTRLRSIAEVTAAGHDSPGLTSLGAIQQSIPVSSRLRHVAVAIRRSSVA
jgi:hypothetical protein